MHDGAQYDRQGNVLRWMICNRQNSLACLKISNCYNKEMELNILACFPPCPGFPSSPIFFEMSWTLMFTSADCVSSPI